MRHYFTAGLICFGVLCAGHAQAGCPQGQDAFTSCQIEGKDKEVFVCFDDEIATYRYGPKAGAADLFLSETIRDVDFVPWSGLGKTIYENVTFYNGDYSYDVFGGFDRPFSEEEMLLPIRRFGGIDVAKNGEHLARIECVPDTVTYGFGGGIYDAKVALGLEWDDYTATWRPSPNHPMAEPARGPILKMGTELNGFEDCLPLKEHKLFGIHLGYQVGQLGKLVPPVVGQPIPGRGPEFERFMYDGLRMNTFQSKIIEMFATTPFWEMPSGIKVGSTRGEVIAILGRVPNGDVATARTFGARVCTDGEDGGFGPYVVIEFGHDKRVQAINLAASSP
ncbi:MAG: hypothetical protein OSA49_00555 [Ascidiaceihabitans sp.]|nr:hypothetical protein [Ascidiaceihabitans sp.]